MSRRLIEFAWICGECGRVLFVPTEGKRKIIKHVGECCIQQLIAEGHIVNKKLGEEPSDGCGSK